MGLTLTLETQNDETLGLTLDTQNDETLRVHEQVEFRTGQLLGAAGLRGQSQIWYSLPPPGFSESGIHLASATGKPLGFR